MIKIEDKLYTSTEVASILGVSLRSVYRYIEENKLTAEVKTATGRHRFTRQDILDFLYPEGDSGANSRENREKANASTSAPATPRAAQSAPKKESTPVASSESSDSSDENTDEVDWLSKFRAAAEKFRQEDSEVSDTSGTSSVAPERNQTNSSSANIDFKAPEDLHVVDEPAFSLENDLEDEKNSNMFYYRSSLGGLKDIAQNLDKSAKEASLTYAFTLNAGLSLHKPIKPFSLLHAYVKSQDVNYFEKLLSLTPSDPDSAQLCLIATEDADVFSNKDALHGLSVVSRNQLKQDIDALAPELSGELVGVL